MAQLQIGKWLIDCCRVCGVDHLLLGGQLMGGYNACNGINRRMLASVSALVGLLGSRGYELVSLYYEVLKIPS